MPGTIVGRERELAAVERFLSLAVDSPRGLVVTGEPGIGKTTIWNAGVAGAQGMSQTVLTTRPLPADARRSLTALADILRDVDREAIHRLPRAQQSAIAVTCRQVDPDPAGLDPQLITAATTSVLEALARGRQVLVAVDDLQWLDRPSARVLEYVGRRLRSGRIRFLAAMRTEIGKAPGTHFLDGSLPHGGVETLHLTGVDATALKQIISSQLSRTLSRSLISRIERASAGNPFFAIEIARSLPDSMLPARELPIPASITELAQRRIARLSALSRSVLLAAASLAVPDTSTVLDAADAPRQDALAALDEAQEAGVIEVDGSVMFVHPIFARTVYAVARRSQRRRMHRRLAELVTDIEERGRHLALATSEPDEEVARVVLAAAHHAAVRGAPDAAAELTELACRLTPERLTADMHRRIIEAAEFSFYAGELDHARQLLERLLRGDLDRLTRANALRILADTRFRQNSLPDALKLYDEALRHADRDDRQRAVIRLALAYAEVSGGNFVTTRRHSERALIAAERAGDQGVIAEALAVGAMSSYLLGGGFDDATVSKSLRLEDRRRRTPLMMRPSLIAGFLRLYEGDLDVARSILRPLADRGREHGEESDTGVLLSYLGWLEAWAGNLAVAHDWVHEAVSVSETPSNGALAHAFSALVHGWMGNRASCEREASMTEASVRETGFAIAVFWSRWGVALLELAHDEPGKAVAALGNLIAMADGERFAEPIRSPYRPDAIDALIGVRELERAERLLDELEGSARRLDRGWARLASARCRAGLLTAQGQPRDARAVTDDALSEPALAAFPLERARLLLVRARASRALRSRSQAGEGFEQAEGLFRGCGAVAWARRARAELERLGLHQSPDELTPSERAIARLAATGMTNRLVADRLSISPKTVEATLSRVYDKLAIHSRAELGARRGEFE